jgi:hypothetical protein
MRFDEPQLRIGYRDSAVSRAKQLGLKALVVLGGALGLTIAVALSLVFVAIALAVVLAVGGYLWWRTRDLRRQMRARMQERPQPAGDVIEGELISREQDDSPGVGKRRR